MAARILIVEDNEKNRRLLRVLLEYHGYEISEAENGESGVHAAREQLPDLILMDIQMPVLDGFGALAALRELPTTRAIKIVALTSFAMAGDRERIIQAGFDDYIPKPIDIRALPVAVAKYLEKPMAGQWQDHAAPNQPGKNA